MLYNNAKVLLKEKVLIIQSHKTAAYARLPASEQHTTVHCLLFVMFEAVRGFSAKHQRIVQANFNTCFPAT